MPHIRAGRNQMIALKEAPIAIGVTAIHLAKKEILNQAGRHIRADQHPMTGPEEILTVGHQAKKEISNQEARPIRTVRVLMINQKEVLVAKELAIKNLAVLKVVIKNAAMIRLSVNRKIHLTINQNLNAVLKTG